MANVLSTTATSQAAALQKGPHRGQSANVSRTRGLDESVSVPVGAPAVLSTEYLRFGRIPAGAKIQAHLSLLSSNHSAAVAGKLQFVPIDGIGTTQEIAGVTVLLEDTAVSGNAETPDLTSVPDVAASLTVTKDSWVQFVPASDLTIASTAKTFYARIGYLALT